MILRFYPWPFLSSKRVALVKNSGYILTSNVAGPDSTIEELTDFICAAQIAKAADALFPLEDKVVSLSFFRTLQTCDTVSISFIVCSFLITFSTCCSFLLTIFCKTFTNDFQSNFVEAIQQWL